MQDDLNFAKDLAQQAGEIMRQYFTMGVAHDLKDDNSPVTEADTKINNLVIEQVKQHYPEDGVIGEEDSFNTGASNVWVVDPIDGTMPFLRGIPINVFSLAYVVNGKPVVGVLYDPHMDRMFYASSGQGAFVNDQKISVSDTKELAGAYIAHEGHKLLKNIDFRSKLMPMRTRVFSYGCIAYSYAMLAAGQFDAVIFPVKNAWDVAAAKIIVEEAGGVTSDMRGHKQDYNKDTGGMIASATPEIHQQLIDIYADSLK